MKIGIGEKLYDNELRNFTVHLLFFVKSSELRKVTMGWTHNSGINKTNICKIYVEKEATCDTKNGMEG
jgi:hypothetical protein